MLKVFWTSDLHLGLKTEEIDRTEEICAVTSDVIGKAVKSKEDGFDTIFVMGGDIFDVNTPSERHIAAFIKLLKPIKEAGLKTFVMVGNHEAIADPKRISCLSFIKELKHGYPSVDLIEDIKMVKVGTLDSGPMYFTFLPHVTKATIQRFVKNKELKAKLTTQEYIESKSRSISKKIGPEAHNLVFSHLNVRGAHPGSEENLLKRSEVFLPEVFLNPPLGHPKPKIIQGHIHSSSCEDNIYIVGSPIFCTFGEALTPKYYAEIHIKGKIGEEDDVFLELTKHHPFMELELNMVGETRDFFSISEVEKFISKIEPSKKPFVKFDISIDPECNNYDWQNIREKVEKEYSCTVKNIVPRVLVTRKARNEKQKLTLTPKKAVQVYLNKNLKKNPEKAKKIYKVAQKYLGDLNEQPRLQ